MPARKYKNHIKKNGSGYSIKGYAVYYGVNNILVVEVREVTLVTIT